MWKHGILMLNDKEYYYEVKVFDEPSEYGINGGRISKLWIELLIAGSKSNPRTILCQYDRGEWVTELNIEDPELVKVYNLIIKSYN